VSEASEIPNQGRGKIARYPREQRDEICRLIRDGAPYTAIIKRCEALRNGGLVQSGTNEPVEIPTEVNLTNFKNSPLFKAWTRHIERVDRDQAKKEFALEYAKENGGSDLVSAKLVELQSDLFEVMDNFDFEKVGERLALNPKELTSFLNALSNMSGRTLDFDKYRDQVRAARAAIEGTLQRAKQAGGLTPQTIEEIEHNLNLL
jgi:hypothetical protein